MPQPTLETRDLTIRFGGHVAVDAVSCAFERGTLTAIVGPNGAGKTTYFNLISGQLKATAGSVWLDGEDISRAGVAERTERGIGRAFQLTNLFPNLTVRENVRLVAQARARRGFDVLSMADTHADLIARAEEVLAQVRMLHMADRTVAALPHGDQRKLEVAMLIALESRVLMLDEPTAGMSVDEVPVVLDLIAALKADSSRTILLVEHKMDVIRSLADRVVVLHNGRLVADGGPQEVMASPIVREAYLGVEAARAEALLTLDGVHTHIAQYHILQGVSFAVPEGGIAVLLGRNGAGKTTCLRTVMGLWRASQGRVVFAGESIAGLDTPAIAQRGIAFVPENMGLFTDLTVHENLLLAARSGPMDATRLEWLFGLFPPLKTFWSLPAGNLSGGQKQMLAVARALIEPRRLILIDEPTKGLAPAIVKAMTAAIAELKRTNTTILLVEQNFAMAREVGDTVAVMDDGRIVHAGSMAALAADAALQQRLMGLSLEAHR